MTGAMITVDTTAGRVAGVEEDGLAVFRGVPFARPPVGRWRFRPPQPVEPWAGVRQATEFGPWAPQDNTALTDVFGGAELPKEEDCLTLNVWTPAADGARRPVMVWIHGGAFVTGSGSLVLYRGHSLARHGDVVVVTINYRLGVLGFAAHPDLLDEETGLSANWGILDQIAALEWVRDNIAGFGGDPGAVTVFGESAGAMSVSTLLGMPRAAGLFHRAIAQSGGPVGVAFDAGARTTAMVAETLGLDGAVAGLRDVPVERILAAQATIASTVTIGGGLPFVPVIDGTAIPQPPLVGIHGGVSAGVSVLAGTNREEMTFFAIGDRKAFALDDSGLRRRVERHLGADAAEAIETYAKSRTDAGLPATPSDIWFALQSDLVFRIPCTRMLQIQAAHQPQTYGYLFTWPSPAIGGVLRSCHALELPFVFDTLDLPGSATFAGDGPDAHRLSRRLQAAWLAFVRTGDPTTEDLGPWPAYGTARTTMVIDADCGTVDAPMEPERAFWDGRV